VQISYANYTSKIAFETFEKVNLKGKILDNTTKKTKTTNRGQSAEKMNKRKELRNKKRCFNCGQRNHMSIDCSTKTERREYFKCGEREPQKIASECIEQPKIVNAISIAMQNCKIYIKEVSINDRKIKVPMPGEILDSNFESYIYIKIIIVIYKFL